jgi:hypothetical protein
LEMPGHLLQGLDPDCISHRQRSQTQDLFNNDLPGIAAVMVQENPYKGSQSFFSQIFPSHLLSFLDLPSNFCRR